MPCGGAATIPRLARHTSFRPGWGYTSRRPAMARGGHHQLNVIEKCP